MDLPRIRDVKDLQAVLDLMQANDIAELELEAEGQRIRLRKSEPQVGGERVVVAAASPGPAAAPAAAAAPVAAEAAPVDDKLVAVDSPLVGTFYRSASPEADPYVQEGDRVDEDTVLGIVEAMKVMNEIRAGKSGVIREILVKNADPVEYGQPLFRLEP